jgi:hypothetical protein
MAKKYEYKFVKINVSLWMAKLEQDHHKVISDHANNGWRLVQIFPRPTYYRIKFYELIFEKEVA